MERPVDIEEYLGAITQLMAARRECAMATTGRAGFASVRPRRGLIGFHTRFLTESVAPASVVAEGYAGQHHR